MIRSCSLRTWFGNKFRGKTRLYQEQRHIIFDLDETLVHTYEERDSLEDLRLFTVPRFASLRPRLYVVLDDIWGVTRPHLGDMMRICFEEFSTVTVWSAGETRYVNAVAKRIFRGFPRPDLIMTRPDCASEELDDSGDVIYTKPLRLVREYYEKQGCLDVQMDASNTLIVEDRPSAIVSEDRFNSVLVPPYLPEPTGPSLMRDDLALKSLAAWFSSEKFRQAPDVRFVPRPIFYSVPVPGAGVRAEYVVRRPIVVAV